MIDSLFEGITFYTSIAMARFEKLCSDMFKGTLEPARAVQAANLTDQNKITITIDKVTISSIFVCMMINIDPTLTSTMSIFEHVASK